MYDGEIVCIPQQQLITMAFKLKHVGRINRNIPQKAPACACICCLYVNQVNICQINCRK